MSDIETQENKEVLPDLGQAEARFKSQLRRLSKNELVRQASNYYMRLTLAGFQIAALKEQITALQTQESES